MTHTTRAHGRRILSILMAFVLALSLLPTAAFAAEGRQGSGTENDPYIINTADQLAGIKNDLDAYYKLGNDIALTGAWTPLGTFVAAEEDEEGETPDMSEAFTGVFDGNGKTISGLTVNSSIAAGLFGCVANGTVKNVTIQNATVSGSCMVAAAVGYAYNSTVENVKLTATESQQSTITANIFNYQDTDMAPNMVAGIVGAGMDSTIKGCTVENTKMTVTGLTQAAGWGSNVHDMGLLGGGLAGTSLEGCTVKNSELSVTGTYSFGIGGLSGCAIGADHVKDCTVNNVKITLGDNAYLTGGLVGYAGKTDGEVTELSGCKSENVQITAGASSSRIGGLIGGGFYLPLYRSYYPVPTSYSVTGSEVTEAVITTGANSAAVGLVAGQGYISSIKGTTAAGTINGAASTTACGTSEDEHSTFLYDLSETYQPLFEGASFKTEYDHYWSDYAAAVVGEAASKEANAVGLMKASIGASWDSKGGQSNSFCCAFTNNIATLDFNGSVITGYNAGGNVVFSHAYQYLRDGHLYGPAKDGSNQQIAYMDMTIYESLDGNNDEFKYFAMCGDTPDTTYHIEFRYGRSLKDLEQMYSGSYAYWLAAGIPTGAVSGQSKVMMSNVIALFCAENLASMTTEETKTQRAPLVGTWIPADTSTASLVLAEDGTVNGGEENVFYAYDGKLITVVDDVCTGYTYTLSENGNTLILSDVDGNRIESYTKWDGYYNISIRENITGGRVSVTGAAVKAKPGETVTFMAAPNDDSYTVTSVGYWTVARDGKEGKLVTLKANEDGSYSFTMPDSSVVIGAAFQADPFISGGSSSSGGGSSSGTTYAVTTPSNTANGTATVSPKNASKGISVTITVKPDSGYVLDQLTVKDGSGKQIALTDKGNGQFTFTMPASKVTVEASFAKTEQPGTTGFTDVSASAYYADAVAWAVSEGITTGTSATTFSPNASCTRGQIVTFLWRAAGSPAPKGTSSFADVPAESYYAQAVAWAVENGITNGTGEGTFSPDASCDRSQSVTFLFRALGGVTAGDAAFSDVPVGSYYESAVAWAAEQGITNGTSSTTFSPNDTCTRGQIVTFLYRGYQGK
ncbi:MAG: S-layer homology domain-containing protein [Firmicutes bacterium]|nr:S-layer homology domain-containing protein [Bacillota bacterium]